MNHHHKLFIDYYTNPQSTETFLNASKSYGKAYPKAKDPEGNAYRLAGKETIKKEIEGRLKALSSMSIEEYKGLLSKEYFSTKNKDSTRLRALELLGKANNFLSDSSNVSVTSTYVSSDDILRRMGGKDTQSGERNNTGSHNTTQMCATQRDTTQMSNTERSDTERSDTTQNSGIEG